MKDIVIVCPVTKQKLRTGMMADEHAFKTCEYEGNQVRCPHCHQIHAWTKKDALLEYFFGE